MKVEHFYDQETNTLTYVVWDTQTRDAVLIDPVLGYSPITGKIDINQFDAVCSLIAEKGLQLRWIFETHAHADHISASQLYKQRFPQAILGISEHIVAVQQVFKIVLSLDAAFDTSGSQFDVLIKDGECLSAGTLQIQALPTPGHTPACLSFHIGDHVFTGDALFMEDYGTGRCDFPGGNAAALYHSVHEVLYSLPDETHVWVGHDYQPNGREMLCQTTIGAQKKANIQLSEATTEDTFVAFRQGRDAGLSTPRLLYASIQVNIAGGHLPEPDDSGKRYLKMPFNADAWVSVAG
jgi:glyoxylase-like metal-dependent hydrolase (beta-lactamase superfamily II)